MVRCFRSRHKSEADGKSDRCRTSHGSFKVASRSFTYFRILCPLRGTPPRSRDLKKSIEVPSGTALRAHIAQC